MYRTRDSRGVATIGLAALLTLAIASPPFALARQRGTPEPVITCDTGGGATPSTGHSAMHGREHGTPAAGIAMMELDQAYIDMMLPHHASIVAMAGAALPRLTDPRLREIAETIVETQGAEIEELRGYREWLYGSPEPIGMDSSSMAAMSEQLMPGMTGAMEEMAFEMDAAAQVAAICGAADADLAFIELTIPHHQMAIAASETAAGEAAQQEIREFAQRVIVDQQREIDVLEAIRAELLAAGTPAQ